LVRRRSVARRIERIEITVAEVQCVALRDMRTVADPSPRTVISSSFSRQLDKTTSNARSG